MSDYAHLRRCIELTRAEIIDATRSRQSCKALVDRMSKISRPKDGGPLLLLLFARMATIACDWLDGDLRIELVADSRSTICDMLTELGQGAGERVFPPFRMSLPLEEFIGAIERVPQMIWPLSLKKGKGTLTLSATNEIRTSTMPPAIDVDVRSMVIPKAPSVPRMFAVDPFPTENGDEDESDE
jgi:hypothetical protein